ncbi:MAG TPA: phosphoribosylformylglycinamidine cyclo-ligase [Desulfobulbaceae bacterium]|nr:phosphoribosylformylglycinamidine cyclo-ligase [Desulfobulbaceae bacterium]
MSEAKESKYSQAGVDIDCGNSFIARIKDIVATTHKIGVLGGIGGFSSLVAIDKNKYDKPVLVNATDGVGTKVLIAQMMGKHDTIGIDLVAMCVNDIVVGGAVPLTFLDYLACGKLDVETGVKIVEGIAEGCRQAQCSLVGGETAEMPGLYKENEYDLAGFVTGIVERDAIIDGSGIKSGNVIIGLASSGLHSNGYSLVRKICFDELGLTVNSQVAELGGGTLGEELLRPTRIYVKSVLNVLKNFKVGGMVHNTGGGFIDNLPRVLPKGLKAVIDTHAWTPQPIFSFLAEKGGVPQDEMFRTFNMGIGLMAIVERNAVEDICRQFLALGETPYVIGEISPHQTEGCAVEIIFSK